MPIKIHRGLDQIGGCITEIYTETSRVFIDFGQNLPGITETTTPEQDAQLVTSILNQNPKEQQAVFYTHAHEDHVGLFRYISIDQYIGESSKEMLLLKYKILEEKNPSATELIAILQQFKTWERPQPKRKPKPITIGDIKITPFFNCHSIYDSHMFLIEADGKRIWHTGDFRQHGYMGKGLFPTLKTFATNIDVLITEGTMLNREDKCIHEREVSQKMEYVMQAFKYVFVLASSTDIERLVSIQAAAKSAKKPLTVLSKFMIETMKLFSAREPKFKFNPRYFSDKILEKAEHGFVVITGISQKDRVSEILQKLPTAETLLIYSSWDGYYKNPEQVQANPKYKELREMFHNVVDIHTSGHADRQTIKKIIQTVNPKEVICIHKEANARLDFI